MTRRPSSISKTKTKIQHTYTQTKTQSEQQDSLFSLTSQRNLVLSVRALPRNFRRMSVYLCAFTSVTETLSSFLRLHCPDGCCTLRRQFCRSACNRNESTLQSNSVRSRSTRWQTPPVSFQVRLQCPRACKSKRKRSVPFPAQSASRCDLTAVVPGSAAKPYTTQAKTSLCRCVGFLPAPILVPPIAGLFVTLYAGQLNVPSTAAAHSHLKQRA